MFKKGSKYTRVDVGWICLPDKGRPAGGEWDTGYVRVEDKLIIFMNIGVPGKTGHDFNNYYDNQTQKIVWYGKPKSHSNQPTFKKLLSDELTPYFFARWDTKDPEFTYLGIGKIVSYKDGVYCKDGKGNDSETIELQLNIQDSGDIIQEIITPIDQTSKTITKTISSKSSAYAKEKELEKFMIKNWEEISLSENYDLVPNKSTGKPGQNWAGSGPLDILAIKKDKSELLVIELKKGQASDEVVGQITRYMGWIKKNLASDNQEVKGLIIALEEDRNIRLSLDVVNNVKFLRYKKFELVE